MVSFSGTEGQGEPATAPLTQQGSLALRAQVTGNSFPRAVLFSPSCQKLNTVCNTSRLWKTRSISNRKLFLCVTWRSKAPSFKGDSLHLDKGYFFPTSALPKLYYSSASDLTYRTWKFRQWYLTWKSVEKSILPSFHRFLTMLRFTMLLAGLCFTFCSWLTGYSNKITPKSTLKKNLLIEWKLEHQIYYTTWPFPSTGEALEPLDIISTRRFSSREFAVKYLIAKGFANYTWICMQHFSPWHKSHCIFMNGLLCL